MRLSGAHLIPSFRRGSIKRKHTGRVTAWDLSNQQLLHLTASNAAFHSETPRNLSRMVLLMSCLVSASRNIAVGMDACMPHAWSTGHSACIGSRRLLYSGHWPTIPTHFLKRNAQGIQAGRHNPACAFHITGRFWLWLRTCMTLSKSAPRSLKRIDSSQRLRRSSGGRRTPLSRISEKGFLQSSSRRNQVGGIGTEDAQKQ